MKHILLTDEVVADKIYLIRGRRVMLDRDLADLYDVETRRLNEQVSRNIERFPDDFRFQLNDFEWHDLKSQFATSSWGGSRKNPFAFTEHGVLMLSSVLSSSRAIQVNIQIMRVYVRLRDMSMLNKEVFAKIEDLEKRVVDHDKDLKTVFDCLRELLSPVKEASARIGFRRRDESE